MNYVQSNFEILLYMFLIQIQDFLARKAMGLLIIYQANEFFFKILQFILHQFGYIKF